MKARKGDSSHTADNSCPSLEDSPPCYRHWPLTSSDMPSCVKGARHVSSAATRHRAVLPAHGNFVPNQQRVDYDIKEFHNRNANTNSTSWCAEACSWMVMLACAYGLLKQSNIQASITSVFQQRASLHQLATFDKPTINTVWTIKTLQWLRTKETVFTR